MFELTKSYFFLHNILLEIRFTKFIKIQVKIIEIY